MNHKTRNGLRQFPGYSPKPTQNIKTEMNHGHNGEKVVVIFNRPLSNLIMTEEEVDAHIAALQGSMQALREHKARH